MHTILKIIIKNIVFSIAWTRDYLYVAKWQLKSLPRFWFQKQFTVQGSGQPVILVPGIFENWRFMQPLADFLTDHGYQVHVVTKLGYNAGAIESMATIVSDYIKEKSITDAVIVAHSKGGLIAKYMLMQQPELVRKVIAINTPFNGSLYARFFILKEVRVFAKSSVSMRRLIKTTDVNKKIVSLYSRFDPHIPEGSELEGATNIRFRKIGHFSPIGDIEVQKLVLDQLNG